MNIIINIYNINYNIIFIFLQISAHYHSVRSVLTGVVGWLMSSVVINVKFYKSIIQCLGLIVVYTYLSSTAFSFSQKRM